MTLCFRKNEPHAAAATSSLLSPIADRWSRKSSKSRRKAHSSRRGRRMLCRELLENRQLLAGDVADLSVLTEGDEAGPTDIVYQVTLSSPNTTGGAITFDIDDSPLGTATAGDVTGSDFTEVVDAPEGLFFGDNTPTVGSGPLTSISGTLGNGDGIWDSTDDHVDAFRITVTDASAFFASLASEDGGAFDGAGPSDNSALYLFDLGGGFIMANDDKPSESGFGGVPQSYLSDPSTFPGGALTNDPGNVAAGEDYVLVVTYGTNDVLDAGGENLADFSNTILDLDGIREESSGVPLEWQKLGAPNDLDDSFSYTIALGGATFSTATDYEAIAAGTQISVAPGESTGILTVGVLDDALTEGTETVIAKISNSSSPDFMIGTDTATATITDNDLPKANLSVTTQGDESGATGIVYTVTLDQMNDTGAAVTFDLDDLLTGTATADADYVGIAVDAQIIVAAGDSSGSLTVTVNDDDLLESTETVVAQISNSSSGEFMIGVSSATASITDNDTAISDLSVTDGDEAGPTSIVYSVTLDKVNNTDAAITFDLDDLLSGTATLGDDYSAISNDATITIPVGSDSGTLAVSVVDDSLLEATDTVLAQISGSSNDAVTIGTDSATANIIDNDTATADLTVTTQGNETGPVDIVYTVTLSKTNDTGAPITFELDDLSTGTATSGDDYAAIPVGATISIAAGASTGGLTVTVVNDSAIETTETVVAQISNSSNASVVIATASATASITDNDEGSERTVESVSSELTALISGWQDDGKIRFISEAIMNFRVDIANRLFELGFTNLATRTLERLDQQIELTDVRSEDLTEGDVLEAKALIAEIISLMEQNV